MKALLGYLAIIGLGALIGLGVYTALLDIRHAVDSHYEQIDQYLR